MVFLLPNKDKMGRIYAALIILMISPWSVKAESATSTYKIDVVYGFTGAAQSWSDYGRMALELARDEINQAGGVNNKKIELIFEDSKPTPAGSVSAFSKLTSIDRSSIYSRMMCGLSPPIH